VSLFGLLLTPICKHRLRHAAVIVDILCIRCMALCVAIAVVYYYLLYAHYLRTYYWLSSAKHSD